MNTLTKHRQDPTHGRPHSRRASDQGPTMDADRRAAAVQAWLAKHDSRQKVPHYMGSIDAEPGSQYPVASAFAAIAVVVVLVWRIAVVMGVL